ncbi:MAG: hypothetical protein WBB39_02790 [Candidatus Saccharimonadales bacterium]
MTNEPYVHTLIVDLDRCLIDSNVMQRALEDAYVRVVGSEATLLRQIEQVVSQSGGSFDMVTALSEQVTTEQLSDIKQRFLDAIQYDEAIYETGAKQFLRTLRDQQKPFFIMTYGGEEWQNWKMAAAHVLDVPHIILGSKDKGVYITNHYDAFGSCYAFDDIAMHEGPWYTQSLTLLDDKAISFSGLNAPRSNGYWYWPRDRELLATQSIGQDRLPATVRKVASFQEVIDCLEGMTQ